MITEPQAPPPGRLRRFFDAVFGYDAAEGTKRRRQISSRIKSADAIVTESKRRKLIENARDLARNFSIAKWAIRRHLDYVTTFAFRPATHHEGVDDQLAELMATWSKNCDVSGRRDLASMLRMLETCRTVDGDVFALKTNDGRLQAIEGDRIRDPENYRDSYGQRLNILPPNTYHGIQCDPTLRPRKYAIHKRTTKGTYEFERWNPAETMLSLGYYDSFDQVRGISPLVQSLNPMLDLYEGFEFALAKMKVSQLFGLTFFRDPNGSLDPLVKEGDGEEGEETEDDSDNRYDVDFGKGPFKLELDAGDRAEFLESQSPAAEFQQFADTMIGVCLKSLDIPYSFYSENFTNFYGSRAAAQQYGRAAEHKQRDLITFLDSVTTWQLVRWIRTGALMLPPGISFSDLKWEWVPAGLPWWKPAEETGADIAAIGAGFTTHDAITRKRLGTGFRETVDTLAEEIAYAKEKGVPLSTFAQAVPPGEPEPDDEGDDGAPPSPRDGGPP